MKTDRIFDVVITVVIVLIVLGVVQNVLSGVGVDKRICYRSPDHFSAEAYWCDTGETVR
jgi:hypothetical protein